MEEDVVEAVIEAANARAEAGEFAIAASLFRHASELSPRSCTARHRRTAAVPAMSAPNVRRRR